MRSRLSCLALAVALAGLAASPAPASAGSCRGNHWVGSWGASPSSPTGPVFVDQSLRLIVNPTLGGRRVRVRFSNRFGSRKVTFASAFVARRRSGASLVPRTSRRLFFRHRRAVVVPAGGDVVSDGVSLRYKAFQDLAVSLHIRGSTPAASEHFVASQSSYVTSLGSGDHAGETSGAAFTGGLTSWPYLTDVEVRAPRRVGALLNLGASTTDGVGSTAGRNARYPDLLARRLAASGRPRLAMQNAGISGNRLSGGDPRVFSGPPMLSRLRRDVIDQAGVTHVLVQAGINDTGLPPPPPVSSAEGVISGLRALVKALHRAGRRVILSTQTPSKDYEFGLHGTPEAIRKRNVINRWTRSQRISDGVVDFHAALRDPSDPDRLRPAYDSGDHQHPNDAGYLAMARAVSLRLLRPVACSHR